MALDLAHGSALAQQLQNIAQQKLTELGWISGGLDDTSLAEYIILSLSNGRTADELSTELANDILGEANPQIPEFVQWLFGQATQLGGQSDAAQDHAPLPAQEQIPAQASESAPSTGADADMSESTIAPPTGPRAMRNGNTRDKRMLNQVNRTLERSGYQILHRVKGAAGRVGREPPKGPAVPRGPRATMNRLANGASRPAQEAFANVTPQQQMQLLSMYEQQAKMMAQIFGPNHPQLLAGQGQRSGKSLFDRVQGNRRPRGQNGGDAAMTDADAPAADEPNPDHATTMCKFNLSCTKSDCYFVHQSPAAPPGTAIDMTDTCAFAAACKNRKCTAKHPSPAQLVSQRADQECKFYPNCTNPACPFKHPNMPACRNGADCTVAGCKFFHVKTACKFNPCLNQACPFKHEPGQKRGSFADKVWTKDGGEHVSERKFVDDGEGEEELIKPAAPAAPAAAEEPIAT